MKFSKPIELDLSHMLFLTKDLFVSGGLWFQRKIVSRTLKPKELASYRRLPINTGNRKPDRQCGESLNVFLARNKKRIIVRSNVLLVI